MSDFSSMFAGNEMLFAWFLAGIVTYITRIGGYVVLARFDKIPARLEAGLDAVPIAVITTLVVPPAINGGIGEFITMVVVIAACYRLPPMAVIILGLGVIIALRNLFGL